MLKQTVTNDEAVMKKGAIDTLKLVNFQQRNDIGTEPGSTLAA